MVANAPINVPAGQNGADGVLRSLTLDRDAEGQRTYDDIANEPAETTRSMHRAVIGPKFFRIKEDFVGLGPRRLKVNDLVMLVPGCHVPITLRASVFVKDRKKVKCDAHVEVEVCLGLECANNGIVVAQRYEVIGETCKYLSTRMRWCQSLEITQIHGVMNGELNSISESDLQEFILAGTEERLNL